MSFPLAWRGVTEPHIFVIGFNKTATRAFTKLFRRHGIPTMHWGNNRLVSRMLLNLKRGDKILSGYDRWYRAFTDLTLVSQECRVEGNRFFPEMDRDYPGSFFILNNRNTDDWIASRMKHADGRLLRRQMALSRFSDQAEAAALWRKEKEAHEEQVRAYFAGNPRFAEVDIDSPDVPGQLSKLLGIEFNPKHWARVGATPNDA